MKESTDWRKLTHTGGKSKDAIACIRYEKERFAEDARNILKKKAVAKEIIKRREMEEEENKRRSKERKAKGISKHPNRSKRSTQRKAKQRRRDSRKQSRRKRENGKKRPRHKMSVSNTEEAITNKQDNPPVYLKILNNSSVLTVKIETLIYQTTNQRTYFTTDILNWYKFLKSDLIGTNLFNYGSNILLNTNLGGGAVKTRNGSSVIRLYSNVLDENSVAAAKHIPQFFAQNNEDNGDEERGKEREYEKERERKKQAQQIEQDRTTVAQKHKGEKTDIKTDRQKERNKERKKERKKDTQKGNKY